MSVIIAAFNEEAMILEKVENTLALDYPKECIEIIVASDASTDRTDEIVCGLQSKGVRLVRSTSREGKEHAQLLAIAEARSDILVFTDVSTRIPSDSVRRMIENFADERVGAVSSEDRLITKSGKVVGEGVYLKYENWLKRLESHVGTTVTLTGAFFAVRRNVCTEWDTSIPSDFGTALNCIRQGYIAVTDPEVLCYYPDIKDENREYDRKFRTVVRGLSAIGRHPQPVNPFSHGMAAFQLFSHKIARWFVPWFLLLLLVSSAALAHCHWLYSLLLAAQLIGYLAALTAHVSPKIREFSVAKIALFFVMVNVAIAHATAAYLLGKRIVSWEPSKR